MKLQNHAALTLPLAAACYGMTKFWGCALGIVIGGILIDLDHWIEFWHDRGLPWDLREFFHFGNSGVSSRLFILFHSFEWIPLLYAGFLLSGEWIFMGVVIGLSVHLVLDYINLRQRFGYRRFCICIFSSLFRLFHRFHTDQITEAVR